MALENISDRKIGGVGRRTIGGMGSGKIGGVGRNIGTGGRPMH